MIVTVTGTPGVGKTRLSKMLSREYDLKYIDFEGLLIKNGLYKEYDEEVNSYVIDIDKARVFLESVDLNNSILDGHNVLLVYPCYKVDKVILLRCSPYILLERLLSKGFNKRKILENVQSEILDVIASDVYSSCDLNKVLEVDVSKGIDDKYHIVISFINNEIGHDASDKVDWLGLISKNNDLNRFF